MERTVSSRDSKSSSRETTGSTDASAGAKDTWDSDYEDAQRFKMVFAFAVWLMVFGVLLVACMFLAYSAIRPRGRPSEPVTAATIGGGQSLGSRDMAPAVLRLRTSATSQATSESEETPEAILTPRLETSDDEIPASEKPSTNVATTSTVKPEEADNSTENSMPSKSLICTYGAKLDSTMVFPPDGLCDFVFFDSLYKNDTNKLDGSFSPNFDYFLTQAKKTNATSYGAGLDYGSLDDIHDFLDSNKSGQTIESLVEDGIRHYGFINTPATLLRMEDVKRALQALEAIDDILADKDESCYTVFAAALYSDALLKNFASMLENEYEPDVLIMYGHFFAEDQTWPDCQIVPPTFVTSPNSGAYIYSLSTAHDSVVYLQTEDIPATLAVSVAMFGRWYRPRQSDVATEHANHSLLSPCQETPDEQLGSVAQVCKHPMWATKVYSNEYQSEYCYDEKMERIFVFDSSKSLISKLCSEKRRVPSTKYAVAAFNLEYADRKNECGQGDFAQLRVLRELVDYLNEKFTDTSGYDGCVSIPLSTEQATGGGNGSRIDY